MVGRQKQIKHLNTRIQSCHPSAFEVSLRKRPYLMCLQNVSLSTQQQIESPPLFCGLWWASLQTSAYFIIDFGALVAILLPCPASACRPKHTGSECKLLNLSSVIIGAPVALTARPPDAILTINSQRRMCNNFTCKLALLRLHYEALWKLDLAVRHPINTCHSA
jgi:hypothetical protein